MLIWNLRLWENINEEKTPVPKFIFYIKGYY